MLLTVDSGIGGLSVVRALRARLPATAITYLADHAGFPYGALSDHAMITRLQAVLGEAIALWRPDALVIACNTASTVALPALRAQFDLPIIGCVPPIKPAATLTRTGTIGMLATTATARRAYVQDLKQRFAAHCTVLTYGSPDLAAQAEQVFQGNPPDETILRHELHALLRQPGGEKIDTIVLGCTHYAFLLPWLRHMAPHVEHWLDPAEGVARRTQTVLAQLPPDRVTTQTDLALLTAPPDEALVSGLAAHGFLQNRVWTPAFDQVEAH